MSLVMQVQQQPSYIYIYIGYAGTAATIIYIYIGFVFTFNVLMPLYEQSHSSLFACNHVIFGGNSTQKHQKRNEEGHLKNT
jgi:hypothetical protein